MEWIEITAKTVPLAVERALDTLGVHETELEYEVVEEGKSTMFGLRKTEARVRARVKPISREKPQDKRRRRQQERKRGDRPARAEQTAATDERAPAAPKQNKPKAEAKPKAPKAKDTPKTDESATPTDGDGQSNRPQRAKAPRPQHREANEMTANGTIEEQVEHATKFGQGLVSAFGVTAEAEARIVADDVIELAITGDNLGLLVGPKAATLGALEEILRGAVGHRGPARLHLDVAGYRQKRREALARFAQGIAREVAETGVAKALEPMGAPDRKVVHDAVTEIDGVTTISDGEDQRRRVIIQPA